MEILYRPQSEDLEYPVRVLVIDDKFMVRQQIGNICTEQEFFSLKESVQSALALGTTPQSVFHLLEVEFEPVANGSGYWALMEGQYNSRNPTAAESLLCCLLLLLRDYHGIYIPLNQEQRVLLGVNLDNY